MKSGVCGWRGQLGQLSRENIVMSAWREMAYSNLLINNRRGVVAKLSLVNKLRENDWLMRLSSTALC